MFVFVEVFKKKKEQCFIHLRQLMTNHDIISRKTYIMALLYVHYIPPMYAEN